MHVLIAPDKFKGCLTAQEVADAIARGVRKAAPSATVDLCPMADGGDGTVATLAAATGARLITRRVTGPLPEMKVEATFAILPDNQTAVIEMAAASGLALLSPVDRNPLNTTTFGTGELMLAAIREGAKKIILGIGGSATLDAGIGAAQACGFTVLTRDGEPVSPTEPLCGRDLPEVLMVKHGRGEFTQHTQIVVACDVTNPLFGEQGAARVFGPQKGADPQTVAEMDQWLKSLATRGGHLEAANSPGAGAAGGFGFGLMAYFNAKLERGFDLIADAVNLKSRIAKADLCITGEGKVDSQTRHGKTAFGVAMLCKAAGVPCFAIAGVCEELIPEFTKCVSLIDLAGSTESAIEHARELLAQSAEELLRVVRLE